MHTALERKMKLIHRSVLRAFIPILLAGMFFTVGSGTALAQESEDELALEEVIVTARKMKENIQEVPVAITAISADLINDLGIRGLADISNITAGLSFESKWGRGDNRPVIRGQGTINGDSGVSYFIDGVYISGSIDDYDINDVERVEVVKGPQSALYGRNTYAGAINIITKSPGDEMSGRASLLVAEDDEYEISATLRGPMTENLSGGITGRCRNPVRFPVFWTITGTVYKSVSGPISAEPGMARGPTRLRVPRTTTVTSIMVRCTRDWADTSVARSRRLRPTRTGLCRFPMPGWRSTRCRPA
jgi:hypothetical protein